VADKAETILPFFERNYPMFNNVKITKAAVEYLAEQYGDDEEQAEEHVITIISMCHFSAAPSPSVEQLQNRVAELEAYVQAANDWFGNFVVHAPITFGGEIEMGVRAQELLAKDKTLTELGIDKDEIPF
jgi:hypothetical protein